MEERIICAANWYKELPLVDNDPDLLKTARPSNCDSGIVFCGHRHHNCLHMMVAMTGKYQHQAGEEVQGFLTNKNRFVDRIEGLQIALAANQVMDLSDVRGNRLHSEDIY